MGNILFAEEVVVFGKRMKILCYIRPWNKEQFECLAKSLEPSAGVIFCSEHASVDAVGLRAAYYANLTDGNIVSDLTPGEQDDFILRCRLLRTLDRPEAVRHLLAMGHAVKELLVKEQPCVVLSLMVDSYIMDLLRHYCESLGFKFVGLVPTFVNGYFRVTARGEPNYNPCADACNIQGIKQALLDPMYAPAFNAKALASPLRGMLRRWAANIARVPYFYVKRHLLKDPYNYHYWAAQIVSSSLFNFFPPSDPGDTDWLSTIQNIDKPVLYIPLQMVPEATVDYWCNNVEVVDYYAQMERFISKHHNAFQIVIKEHPSVMSSRPFGFYQRLARDKRVTVVPTYTPSNEVLAMADAVLVWTGSVGFEAALRGKSVICLGDPYYLYGSRFLKINPTTESGVINEHIQVTKAQPVSPEEQDELISYLATQLFLGNFKNDGTWSEYSEKDLTDCKVMANSLRALLECDVV
ncbi:capsular polysaccharide export protein, LipB/KpsS family [Stutzerimonas nitrititolerans]|uniref:capsular polysaccharide export protein, LipB/KpsS family n=1 Tax=Stutzerimonas nitrititolerans TaxID=2482751 RepID=UPI0028A24BA6|nr:hypothetical protein [Stutzerimonas nitrititolerans]